MSGRYVPSLLAAIGGIIERHMIDTGFLQPNRSGELGDAAPDGGQHPDGRVGRRRYHPDKMPTPTPPRSPATSASAGRLEKHNGLNGRLDPIEALIAGVAVR